MALDTPAAFLDVLERSDLRDLLSEEQRVVVKKAAQKATDARTLAAWMVQKELLNPWQAGQLLQGRTSFCLGKYKLVDLLGKGGMAKVYLAHHTMMQRPVAIKTIAKELSKDSGALSRFLAEARNAASLDHPNIVHAYNVDNEGAVMYMVLEYVEGRDLQRVVEAEGPLEFPRAVDYIRQAADGLAHAHGKGMIHCDIKPSNLLVNTQGTVKILDMGMARFSGKEKEAAGAAEGGGGLIGTIDYMAPEQAANSQQFDHRADIYSLGCTLYYLLTGHPPFPEGTIAERIVKHQTQEPRSIVEARPAAPRDLVRICRKMMAKNPADRYQSAEEVSRILGEWRPQQRVLKAVPLDDDAKGKTADAGAKADAEPSADQAATNGAAATGAGTAGAPVSARGSLAALVRGRRGVVILSATGAGVLLLAIGLLFLVAAHSGKEPASPVSPSEKKSKTNGEEKKWGALKLEVEEPAAAASAGESKPNEAPKTEAGKPESKPDPANAEPSKPAAPPAAPPAKPGAGEMKSADPPAAAKPEAKVEAKPNPKPEAKPEAKPAAPKPKPAPPPKPAGDPLRDLPKTVDLPELEEGGEGKASAPKELGRIHTAADVPWSIELIGGDTALRRNRPFTMEAKEVEGKPAWVVSLPKGGSKDEEPTAVEVARLWRDKESLMFQWLAGAAGVPANHLRNCILEIRGGGPLRPLPLRSPKNLDPLVIDLQRGMTQAIALEWWPDPSAVRLEITEIEGKERVIKKQEGNQVREIKEKWNWVLEPREPVEPKTPLKIVFYWKDRFNKEQVSPVHLDAQLKPKGKDLVLDVRLRKDVATQFKSLTPASRAALEMHRKTVEEQLKKNPPNKMMLERQLDQNDFATWCAELYQCHQGTGKIHFRLFALAGSVQLELARTSPPKPAK